MATSSCYTTLLINCTMVRNLSFSLLLTLCYVVSAYGYGIYAAEKTPLSIAVAAFDNQTHSYSKERIRKEVLNRNVRWTTHLLTAAGLFYQATGEERFLDMAEEIFRCATEAWKKDKTLMQGRDDFFSTRNVAATYELLKKTGRLKGDEAKEIVIRFAELHFEPNFIADHNQGQERALGFTRMYRLFPDAPQAERWKEYTDKMWDFWYRNKDVDETATLYAAIHLNDIITIAEESGRSALLQTPETERWFARYLHQQAPSGYMPEYGDDFFFAYFEWIVVFEKMARLTGNPAYRQAAEKLYRTGLPNLPEKYTKRGWYLRDACEWASIAEAALLPPFTPSTTDSPAMDWGAMVTTRTNRNGISGIPDQLLLASSHHPGSPFVMSDLYAEGAHKHPNLRGTINYFETDGCPHFHGVQRHATDMRHGNTVILMKEEENGFPFGKNANRRLTDRWFTDWIDFSSSTLISENNPQMRGFQSITFRFQNGRAGEVICIDSVRLRGKAGEQLLHDCNTLEAWGDGVELADNEKGGKMIRITLKDDGIHFFNLNIAVDFSLDDYRYIGCNWKHVVPDGKEKSPMSFMIRAYNKVKKPVENYVHEQVGVLFNPNIVRTAHAENKDEDSYGEVILDNHCVDGTTLQRRMVLTTEGILVLQDQLLPGTGTNGYTAGSIWQLYQVDERGENWFSSRGGKRIYRDNSQAGIPWKDTEGREIARRQLLVYFEKSPERSYGFQKQDYTIQPTTVFAKQQVTSSQPLTFVTVIVPFNKQEKATEIVNALSVKTLKGHSTVEMTENGQKITITIDAEGNWNVTRK